MTVFQNSFYNPLIVEDSSQWESEFCLPEVDSVEIINNKNEEEVNENRIEFDKENQSQIIKNSSELYKNSGDLKSFFSNMKFTEISSPLYFFLNSQ